MISKEEVIHIAKLARLELTDREVEKMQKDLSCILDYFELLKKSQTPKLSVMDQSAKLKGNVVRKDEAVPKNPNLVNDLIAAAPDKKDGYIKVKNIF